MPDKKAPTKAEAVLAAFDAVGVDAPMSRIKAALAAKGVTPHENYIYDLKKVYRQRRGAKPAPQAAAAPAKPAPKAATATPAKPQGGKPGVQKAAARKKAAPKRPATQAAHSPPVKTAAAPVVEAVRTAQHLLNLVSKADAQKLLDLLASG